MSYNYLKEYRLRDPQDYKDIRKMGCKLHTPHFLIYTRQNRLAHARLGMTVSKKVGNAVVRNRIKRYIKEYFRVNRLSIGNNDFSVIAKRNAGHLLYEDVSRELAHIVDGMVDI